MIPKSKGNKFGAIRSIFVEQLISRKIQFKILQKKPQNKQN